MKRLMLGAAVAVAMLLNSGILTSGLLGSGGFLRVVISSQLGADVVHNVIRFRKLCGKHNSTRA